MKAPDMFWCWGELGPFKPLNNQLVMHSAGVAWNNPGDGFTGHVPDARTLWLDSGGFQSTTKWDLDFPYTPRRYFTYADEIGADYVACMDLACEPELHPSDVNHRIEQTIANTRECFREYKRGDYQFYLVPVLQGWEPEDYRYCAQAFERYDMTPGYLAIGTVCKRQSTDEIHRVLRVCRETLPDRKWHLFGATLNTLKDRRLWGRFDSFDTAAWKWGAESKEHKKQLYREYRKKVERYTDRIESQSKLV